MTIRRHISVECDHCKKTLKVNTNDELEAESKVRKFGWLTIPVDSYGNTVHFCAEFCRSAWFASEYEPD